MSNTRNTGFLTNVIKTDSEGNVTFVSGSTTLLSISSSGAVTTTGVISGSNALTSSYSQNSELLDNLDSTSFVFTSSYNSASSSMSTRVTNIEGNYATTGSNVFLGAQTVCANITSTGTIIAQTLNVQQVTSSIVYSSGSNTFGCLLTDRQQFTGSVTMTGSLGVVGVSCFSNTICAPKADFTSDASCVAVRLINGTITGGSTTGVTGLYLGDAGSGVAMLRREKYAANQANLVLYSEYGYSTETINACLGYNGIGFFTAGTQRQFIDGSGNICFSGTVCTATGLVSGDITLNSAKSLKFASNANSYIAEEYGIRLNFGGNTSQYGAQFYNQNGTKVAIIDATGGACISGLQVYNSADPGIDFYRTNCNIGAGTGRIYWSALDSTATKRIYTYVQSVIEACSSTAFCSRLEFILSCTGDTGRRFMINGAGVGCFSGAVCSPTIISSICAIVGTTSSISTYGTLTVAGTGISIADDGNAKLQIGRYSATACNAYIKMGTNACSLRFTNSADTLDVVVMDKGGNVGINNTTPCGKLQISLGTVANGCFRNVAAEAALTIEACGNSYLQFMNCATSQTGIMFGNTCLQYSGMIWYRHDLKQLMLGANNTEILYLCGGRVGVATSTPSAGFHSVGTLKYQNSTYNGFAQSFVWQSSFNNPPQLLYQFTSGNNYAQTLVKVTFIQNGVSAGYAGWFEGYALAHRNPTALTTVAYTMTAQHNPNGITAPTLSWSGCALCITPNRATNYDGYIAYVEWGGNTNNNETPEIPV